MKNKSVIVRVHTRVRKDGAINITKNARKALGLVPYREVDIEIVDGMCTIRPAMFNCRVCDKYYDEPLDNVGVCKTCNQNSVDVLANRKASTVAEAIDAAKVLANKGRVGRKI